MSDTQAKATALRERGRKLGIIDDDWTSLVIEAFEAFETYVAASPGPLSAADWLDVLLNNIEVETLRLALRFIADGMVTDTERFAQMVLDGVHPNEAFFTADEHDAGIREVRDE